MPNFITLPRSELYELVWSKPVTEVAAEFGISDVALAKRCRALNIPLPWRGYWAKVQAGQSPRRTPLRPFRDARKTLPRAQPSRSAASQRERPRPQGGAASLSLPSYASASSGAEPLISFPPPREPRSAAPPMSPEEAALRAPIDALVIAPLDDLTHAHPAVLRTAVHQKHLKSSAITWPRGTRSGPILDATRVSNVSLDRALRVLNAVLRGAETLGWTFVPPPPDPAIEQRQRFPRSTYRPPEYGHLMVDSEPVQLRIDERQRQSDHVMTDKEKLDRKRGSLFWMPRFDYMPTGELRLHATEPGYTYRTQTWKDTARRPLETKVPRILHGLLTIALERKQHREEERLRRIAEREAERLRELVRQRRAANTKLIHTLEAQAGAWARAQLLRRYLRAARRSVGDRTITTDLQGQSIDYLAWAEHYVNQLDPLHPDLRDPELAHEQSWQYNSEEKRFTEELQRLLGHAWELASKLG